jgi:hypothetical protein
MVENSILNSLYLVIRLRYLKSVFSFELFNLHDMIFHIKTIKILKINFNWRFRDVIFPPKTVKSQK